MTKKIPRSSLPLVLISLIGLYIIFWIVIILSSIYAPDIYLSHILSIMILLVVPACLALLVLLAAFLYLKRDKPTGTRQGLAIVAMSIFGLITLQTLIIIALNLVAFFSGGELED